VEGALDIERLRAVKAKHEKALLRKKNVVGVGVGFRKRRGELTGELALIVMVRAKYPDAALDPHDLIPSELDGVPVDIQPVGELRAL